MDTIQQLDIVGDSSHCTSAIIVRNEKILLGLRHYTKDKWKVISVWTTPGGRCDAGESLETTLRRETAEETGITQLDIKQFICEVPGAIPSDRVFAFLCESTEEPILMEPEKFSEWRWFALEDIPENFINAELLRVLARILTEHSFEKNS